MTDTDPTAPRERPRTLAEAKEWMLDRTAKQIHPMNNLSLEDTASVVNGLRGLDPVNWAAAWRPAGEAAWAEAEKAEAAGDLDAARKHYMRAHGFFFMGRFPCPNHPDKMACHVREREAYLKAGALFENPVTKIAAPPGSNARP
ncbi:MAG: hypothetical protein VW891_05465 [Novosphingobium sp.]